MKTYIFLSVLFLLCLSAETQEEITSPTNEEAVSILQEAVRILGQYNLITDGEEWFLAEQDAVTAINEHNRTASVVQRQIISDRSYKRNYEQIPGLPSDPDKVYGDKWLGMKEKIAQAFLKAGKFFDNKKQNRSNKVLVDGHWRFLTTQETVTAINEHNRTASEQNKIISTGSYIKNYGLIPGLHGTLRNDESWYYPNRRGVASQVIGWMSVHYEKPHGNKVLVDGHWRFLTEQEAVTAINEHNQTALEQHQIISKSSYKRNHGLIPGLPSNPNKVYGDKWLDMKEQIVTFLREENLIRQLGENGNQILVDGRWRFLTEQEIVTAINEYNRTAPKQDQIISEISYVRNYKRILGLPSLSRMPYELRSVLKSQIVGWSNIPWRKGPRGNKILVDGHWRFLTEQEIVTAVNEYNRTASEQNKIISENSYKRNYKRIPGLPSFNIFRNSEFLDRVIFQIIGWDGTLLRREFLVDGRWPFLTEQEAISAINAHNQRTVEVKNKIISTMSYQENYGLIPGLPPNPWVHYGLNRWQAMLENIQFEGKGKSCAAQFLNI